jgi:hypothetical protein
MLKPESAVEETSRHEREAILEQQRHGTVRVHRIFPLYHPVVVALEIRTQVPTHEGRLSRAKEHFRQRPISLRLKIRCGNVASRSSCQVQLQPSYELNIFARAGYENVGHVRLRT